MYRPRWCVGLWPALGLIALAGFAVAAADLELTSHNDTGAGTADSGRDGFGAGLASRVLDDGTVFFVSLASLGWPEDPNGNVNVFQRDRDGTIVISIAGLWPAGERLQGNVQSIASDASGERLCLLRYDQNGPLGTLRLALLEHSGDAWRRSEPLGQATETSEAKISANGEFLLFVSATDGLYPGDENGRADLFRYEIATEIVKQIPVPGGLVPSSATISDDGTVVAFLAGGKAWVHVAGTSAPVCVSGDTTQAAEPAISGNGEWVAFRAEDGAGATQDRNGVAGVYRVRADGTGAELVSVETGGNAFATASNAPTISAEGRFVAFVSAHSSAKRQVWLRDCAAGMTWRVSEASPGVPADADCTAPALSPSGRYVTFPTAAGNLPSGNGTICQVYRFDQGTHWLDPNPEAPQVVLADDTADTLVWEPTDAFPDVTEYERSLDGGITWQPAGGTILWLGNVVLASGEVLVRVLGTDGRPAGKSLVVEEAFTQVPVDPDRWTLLLVNTATSNSVVLGTAADEETAETDPLQDEGVVLLGSEDQPLRVQVQQRNEPNEWRLRVGAPADRDLTLRWLLPGDFPEGRYLSLWREDRSGSREESPSGASTAQDMGRWEQLTVPAGEEWDVCIRFATDLVCDLAFYPGWNLVSLPVQLHDPRLAALRIDLPELGETAWRWQEGAYVATDELAPLDGAWLYYGGTEKTVLLVAGMPVGTETVAVGGGWSLLGPREPVTLPDGRGLIRSAYAWDAARLRYIAVDDLHPGLGTWLWATEETDVRVAVTDPAR